MVHLNNSEIGCADPNAIKIFGKVVFEVKKNFPHASEDAIYVDYTDFDSPEVSIIGISFTNNILNISLGNTFELRKLEFEIDAQLYMPIVISNFENVSFDISELTITEGLLTIYASDEYLNTNILTANIFTGINEINADNTSLNLYSSSYSSFTQRMEWPV